MIRKYAEIFCWKNVSSFCNAKATHIFSAKNIRMLCIESAKTVNEMTLNELVKLTTLWTTGPWLIYDEWKRNQILYQRRICAGHSISYKIACAPNDDSDQPAHPHNLISVSTEHSVGSYASTERLQADRLIGLIWVFSAVSRLKC